MSTPLRVLSIEDNRDDYDLLVSLLSGPGRHQRYEVDWARSFPEGVTALVEGNYDVSIVDYSLGSRDGIDLLQEATQAGANVPMIFLTGRGNAGVEKRALAAGAADYLVKGDIDAERLERSIRHSVERGRSAAILRERERQVRSVFDGTLDAMLIANDEGRCVEANEAALALLGVRREELPSIGIRDVVPAEMTDADLNDGWAAFLREGRVEGEMRMRRRDGRELLVELRATARIMKGRHLLVLRDLTDRKRNEGQRLRLAAMVECAVDAIAGLTLDGVIDYWNASAERTFGYPAAEALGRPLHIVLPEDDVREFEGMLAAVRSGEAIHDHETRRRRKDGTIFAASVTLAPVTQLGEIVAISAVTRDISMAKRLEHQLAISDRMASMGTLAAGVAHEINNPLAAVIANLDLLTQQLEPTENAPGDAPEASAAPLRQVSLNELLTDARASADRIRHIVRDLKLFSRPDEERRGPVDLNHVLDSTLRMAWNEIRHRARLVKDYGAIPPVHGNEARLAQVFLNLVVNAAQAIREGNANINEIRVVTRQLDETRVVAEIRDTGVGIPEPSLRHLFDPFFTTKPLGVGTGLGLSICRRIVDELGGTIEAESTEGVGTVFRVTLPATAPQEETPTPSLLPHTDPGRRGRVVVLDDEPLVAEAVRRALQRNHDVTVFGSAADALRVLETDRGYDVIICDMMMPQMTGVDFYAALRGFAPEYLDRIVFLTGGAFSEAAGAFLDRVSNACVEKPFNARELRALVDRRVSAAPHETTPAH